MTLPATTAQPPVPKEAPVGETVGAALGGRNAGLDALRLVAVVLVTGRHPTPPDAAQPALLRDIAFALHTGGWVGVDLFFVLSGFLVSGLFFSEHARTGRVHPGAFLIRRGFKIYPPFWLLILATVLFGAANGAWPPQRGLAGELLFLQNYVGNLWPHTWSLAVEEHFYLGLAALVWLVVGRGGRADFRWVPAASLLVAVSCLAFRCATWLAAPQFSYPAHFFPTHLRVDALFYGVMLSYFHHFDADGLAFTRWRTRTLVALGTAMLVPAFFFPLERYWLVSTVGFVVFYVAAGFLLTAALRFPAAGARAFRLCALLGASSYSVYLWHMPVNYAVWFAHPLARWSGEARWYVYALSYVIGAFAIGLLAAVLVEGPALRLRNRLVPSRA